MKHFLVVQDGSTILILLLMCRGVFGFVENLMFVFYFLYGSGFFVNEPIAFPLHFVELGLFLRSGVGMVLADAGQFFLHSIQKIILFQKIIVFKSYFHFHFYPR